MNKMLFFINYWFVQRWKSLNHLVSSSKYVFYLSFLGFAFLVGFRGIQNSTTITVGIFALIAYIVYESSRTEWLHEFNEKHRKV
jgi:hypothetical protein